jgi:hypothetical protein
MPDQSNETIRTAAYLLWEGEGRPEGRDLEFWLQAKTAFIPEEEKVLAEDPTANIPALLTKDVPGG